MRTVTRGLVLFTAAQLLFAFPSMGQQSAPCVSTWVDDKGLDEYYEARMPEIFSDSLYADGRSYYSLATLPSSEPSITWSTTGTACRTLLQDAVDAINAKHGTTQRWQTVEYVVIDIGPYLVLVNLSTTGLYKSGVVFDAAADSIVAIIPMN